MVTCISKPPISISSLTLYHFVNSSIPNFSHNLFSEEANQIKKTSMAAATPKSFLHNSCQDSINPELPPRKKRNLPGTPDPNAEVIALSPKSLLATNRFLCEICGKGFQRDQNLQLHRRGHNLPWKLKQRSSGNGTKEGRKRVYVCPEKNCVHHNPARALGDLTGIKKHFCRKHGEKKWKCEKCSKRYAVMSDWKAHLKTCGMRDYRCDCGTLFSRRDSFITHRAFCDALADETTRISGSADIDTILPKSTTPPQQISSVLNPTISNCEVVVDQRARTATTSADLSLWLRHGPQLGGKPMTWPAAATTTVLGGLTSTTLPSNGVNDDDSLIKSVPSMFSNELPWCNPTADMSATALLQKASQIGVTSSSSSSYPTGSSLLNPTKSSSNCGNFSSLDLLEMYSSSCPIHDLKEEEEKKVDIVGGGGGIRDFLGVGFHHELCHPSIQGWI